MKIENQVVSLELAKKLKAAGYSQDSYWYWYTNVSLVDKILITAKDKSYNNKFRYSAPTVAELGEKLPITILYKNDFVELHIGRNIGNRLWCVWYSGNPSINTEKIADAMAKMYLYLKDKGLL